MKHSLFWAAVEAAAKATRSGLSVVGALVDCGIPRQHAGEQWLTGLEEDVEVWEAPLSADYDDEAEARFKRNPQAVQAVAEAEERLDEAVPIYLCDNCGTRLGEIAAKSQIVPGMFCSTRCVSVAEVRDAIAEVRNTPQNSRTNAGATSSRAVEETSEGASPPAAPSDVLPDYWVAIAIPVITEVLADHFAEQRFTAVSVSPYILCHHLNGDICGEFADRRDHRSHVAPLIADRLEAVTLALPEEA